MARVHILLLVLGGLVLASCADDSTAPPPPSQLSGRVLDAQGDPVAGATIALVFDVEVATKARIELRFFVPERAELRARIQDIQGRTVRVLYNGTLDAGPHLLVWDGSDDEGTPLPNGLYRLVIDSTTSDGSERQERELMLVSTELADLSRRANAMTDGDGRFAIELDLLPLGHPLTFADEMGEEMQGRISRTVEVHAFAVAGEPSQGHVTDTRLVPEEGTTVTLQLP